MHTIPLAPAGFQPEHLWPDKVLVTSRRQRRFQLGFGCFLCIHQICLAHPDRRLYSHPISERVQEAARNDSHHH